MSVVKKDPAKPGYMSTEFWAMVLYGISSKVGLSPEQTDETVSSFSNIFDQLGLGDSPILGVVIIIYIIARAYIKKTEINAQANIEIRKPKDEV